MQQVKMGKIKKMNKQERCEHPLMLKREVKKRKIKSKLEGKKRETEENTNCKQEDKKERKIKQD